MNDYQENFHNYLIYLKKMVGGLYVPFLQNEWNENDLIKLKNINDTNKTNPKHGETVYELLKKYYGPSYNIFLTNSGRSALLLILKNLDLKKSDEIIIPSYSCLGLIQPILKLGLKPYFVDINNDLGISFKSIKKAINKNTKVIIIPHLGGSFSNIESSIKEMTALVEQGFEDETELDQLQLMKSDLESSIQSANQSHSVAKQMLKLNMGLEVSKTIGLSDSLVGIVDLISIEALAGQQFDAANNPNLKALSSQRDLLGLDVKRYKAQRLPRVAAFYQYQNTAYQFEWDWLQDAGWYDAQNVGVNISIPILSSGQQGAVINQAKLELTKMENMLTYAQSAMGIQFTNAINGLNSKHANYQNAEKSLKIAQKIFNRTEIKHQEGMASSFELSQMKTQVLQSQGKYIQSLFNLLNAKAELDKLQNK